MHRIADLTSYDADNPYGLELRAHDVDSEGMQAVEIQLTPTDLAFMLCGMVAKYGLDNVRRAVDRIALDDPSGQHVGLSAPANILQGKKE